MRLWWLEDFFADLRQATRGLIANPLFTLVALVTLALGIGANTAIFSVMNAVVLRLLPVRDPQHIFLLRTEPGQPEGASNTGDGDSSFSEYVFEQLRNDRGAFADVMAYVPMGFNKIAVRAGGTPTEAAGEMVSGNYFSGLGVQPECGRLLTSADERDHTATAVLSFAFWNRRFNADCGVIGKTIDIKGVPFTIAGVANRRFIGLGGNPTDLWVPLQSRPDFNAWGAQSENYYAAPKWWCVPLAARIAPGLSKQQAEAAASAVFLHAAYEHLGGKPHAGEKAPTLQLLEARGLSGYRDDYRKPLTILLVMVAAILVIACGNVSMLLAARNTARRREFSIRVALGGSTGRLFRQLLAESLVLVVAGAVLGWCLALAATAALAAWSNIQTSLAPDGRVLLFTLAISLAAGLVFGLTPLFRSARVPVGEVLRTSVATSARDISKARLGRFTTALQVALCLMLLAGTVLLMRTLRNLEHVNLGFRANGLLVFGVNPRLPGHADQAAINFYRALLARFRSLPEVESATLMGNRIGSGWSNNTGAFVDSKPPKQGQDAPMRWNNVGPGYFHTLGVPLVYGRDFDDADTATSARVGVVNSTFVKKYLAGRNALGHTVGISPKEQFTIVGVAQDSKYTQVKEEPIPMAYFPYTQEPEVGAMHVELRTYGDPKRLLGRVGQILLSFGPELAPLQPMTQREQFEMSISGDRLVARLALFFGLLAIALVATGLYGTVAYNVGRRTSELGIRMALGAQRGQVIWMILREGLLLCGIGLLIGLPLTFAATRLLGSLLYGLKSYDPSSLALAIAGIVLVTILACLIPARRAAGINPAAALRNE